MVNGKKNRTVGFDGEKAAKEFLKENNYKIVEQNFRTRFGEIDIIAKDGNYIVFVEVKTRGEKSFGNPMEAVDYPKQKKIIMASEQFLLKKEFFDLQPRFDVIEVFSESGKINHIINAF
ncbi:MAG: YraN family protein [Clostridia bacterium]|nr:YraN family protein [Clostridia bacterium]MBQ6707841.1 YraN family protein [Clostridia bacterium]